MAYLDRHPNQFRFLFTVLAAILFALGGMSFYRVVSRPTDENIFTNPSSNLYVATPIPAVTNGRANSEEGRGVRVGDLVERINAQRVVDSTTMHKALSQSSEANVDIVVSRPATLEKFEYRVRKNDLTTTRIRDLGPTAQVVDVIERGASDRAGMKVGDLILRINGQRFKNSLDADRILAEGQIGKALVYDVIRENTEIALHVSLAAIGVPFPLLVSTLSGVLFMLVAIFLGLVRPLHKALRLSALSTLAFGYIFMVLISRRGLATSPLEMVRDIAVLVTSFAVAPVTFHSGHYFPLERTELTSRKWITRLGYALALAGIAATLLFDTIGLVAGLALVLVYFISITLFYRKKVSAEFKRLNRIVRITSTISGLGAAALGTYFIISDQPQSIGYIGFALLLIPAAHLYTIGRYRLFDLDLRIRRNAQYILVRLLWNVAIAVAAFKVLFWLQSAELPIPNIQLTATSVELLEAPMGSDQRIWLEKGMLMLAAVIVVYSSWRIAGIGRRVLDTYFSRAHHDYRRAANELTEVMATKLTMVDLARGMVESLAGLLQLKRVGVLFFRDQRQCCCQEVHGFNGSAWAEYCLSSEASIAEALHAVAVQASMDSLPQQVRAEFEKHGFLYVIPIRSKEELVGALLVGEKKSEAPYQQEDLDFLEVVAKQASVAIENAFLYEELAEQERMKHELAIARRIQLASLPQQTPTDKGLQIAGTSQPALEVGGDYFDYLNGRAGSVTIVVGDVSGKGTSAALYMSKVQGIIRSLHAVGLSPKDILVQTNKLLCGDLEKKSFITSIMGSFEPEIKKLVLARAGHLPLYHYDAGLRQVVKITPRGLGLGLEATDIFLSEIEERAIRYRANDVFLFASDGVIEAEGTSGNQFGEDNLARLVAEHSAENADIILGHIMQAVQQFSEGREQHDDQTLVVVKAV